MKDLKHLYTFEKLLEEANNELVKKSYSGWRYCSRLYLLPYS